MGLLRRRFRRLWQQPEPLGLECHRGLESFRVAKAFGFNCVAVFCLKFIQGAGIQSVHGASFNADGLLSLFPSFQTKVALLHLGVLFRTELGCIPRAGIKAECVTLYVAQAFLSVYYYDAIGLSFGDGVHRAS